MNAVCYRAHSLTSTAVHPSCLIFGWLATEVEFKQHSLLWIPPITMSLLNARKLRMLNIRYCGYKRRAQRRAFTNAFLFQPLTANNLLSYFVRVSNFSDIKMMKIFALFRTVIKNRSRREKRSGRMGRIVGSLKRLIAIRQLNSSK